MWEIAELISSARAEAPAIAGVDIAPIRYGELAGRLQSTRDVLRSRGIGPGDPVAIVLPNGPALAVTFLSVCAVAAAAPLNPAYSHAEFDFLLRDLQPAAIVTSPGFCPAVEQAAAALEIPVFSATAEGLTAPFHAGGRRARVAPDVALLLHTSGTTSRPKLVPLTRRNLCASACNIATTLALGEGDCCLNVMPLFHIHGLVGCLLASLRAGAGIYCTPGFDALRFGRYLEDSHATWYSAVPTMHQAIVARTRSTQGRRLRFVRSSSSPLYSRLWHELETVFECPAVNAYGMTEASHQITTNLPGGRKIGTVGVAGATEFCVLDGDGNAVGPDVCGEIGIRGAAVTSGYLRPAEANERAFAGSWLRTGDLGWAGADGYLRLEGRIKEIINSGGEKIAPAEVDEVLLAHPEVAQAMTFPAPHRSLGEQVCAAVVRTNGETLTESGLRSFVAERLARFKVPRRIFFVAEIPKGATGKPQRSGMAVQLGLA